MTGSIGPIGRSGATGPQGLAGQPVPQGCRASGSGWSNRACRANGATGLQGPNGPAGPKGDMGLKGRRELLATDARRFSWAATGNRYPCLPQSGNIADHHGHRFGPGLIIFKASGYFTFQSTNWTTARASLSLTNNAIDANYVSIARGRSNNNANAAYSVMRNMVVSSAGTYTVYLVGDLTSAIMPTWW